MQNNILEYLENTILRVPDKVAFSNGKDSLTFKDVYDAGRSIGSFMADAGIYKQPVVVFMNKHPRTIAAFLGVVYGGDFYVPIDEEMPMFRIELIFKNLNPGAVICDESTRPVMQKLAYSGPIYMYEDLIKMPADALALDNIRESQIDTDPIYIVFTSGSTGIPKGVVACHRSVLDYIEAFSGVLKIDEKTVFGMQVPLYFDACLKEIYPTLKFGSTTYIIPKSLFMFPIKLVEYMNEYKINTICWVVSALTMISAFGTFNKIIPGSLRTVAFGSEVLPIKQLNLWRNALPAAQFINLYGPTEATGMSCYFLVDREFSEGEVIPIGRPFKNTAVILLDANQKIPQPGDIGEICIRGTSLTLGYYKAFGKTNEVFVQNPLNDAYPELIYRTGDLGKYNDRGELVFVSRKDYQIKHMGHRIELGEIEVNVNSIEGIKIACCVYDKETEKIVLYYVGDIEPKEVMADMKSRLPRYMLPNLIEPLEKMPLTSNAKIDRVYLKEYTSQKNKERHNG
ncbi:MAG: AMP-binding protein [Clostridiaceae bacterium]|nr:AMP-binding protein [Clostridiaceae bacterium]